MVVKEEVWNLFKKLFPIYRTLMGEGFNSSLALINSFVQDIRFYKIPSQSICGSWVIPNEWNVNEAWIANLEGVKLVDFKDSQFHLWQYSISTDEMIKHNDLLKKLTIGKNNCIPLSITYYKKRWGFSISSNQLIKFDKDKYHIFIDTEFKPGNLIVGEIFIKGKSNNVVLIDSVLSCNSLANNLSGVMGAVYLAKYLKNNKNLFYSYRILFTPETLGPISIAYKFPELFRNVIGGFNIINIADNKPFLYKKSRKNTIIDQAVAYSIERFDKKATIKDFDIQTGRAGNEKSYNSLGIEIPIGALRRSELSSYEEYDTSEDNFNYISKTCFFESLDLLRQVYANIESNQIYKHCFIGEPFLTGYGVFDNWENEIDRKPYDYIMGFTDGKNTLIDIVVKSGIDIEKFNEPIKFMSKNMLIKRVEL